MLIRIRMKAGSKSKKIQELWRLEMEPWRAVDAHIGGMEFHNGAVEGLYVDQTYAS
jgi:hypothetical protein